MDSTAGRRSRILRPAVVLFCPKPTTWACSCAAPTAGLPRQKSVTRDGDRFPGADRLEGADGRCDGARRLKRVDSGRAVLTDCREEILHHKQLARAVPALQMDAGMAPVGDGQPLH